MAQTLKNYNQTEFLVPPFSIDNKDTKIIDDGFSITCNSFGNYSLNIHVSAVALEYLRRGFKIDQVIDLSRKRLTKDKEATEII